MSNQVSSGNTESQPTFVVELTPPGRAAVAVILVDGPGASRAVANHFAPRSGQSIEHLSTGRIYLGRWGSPAGEELIVCRRGDNRFEIHCHGGAAAALAVMNALVNDRCVRSTWQDWVQKNSADPIAAAARIALAEAVTERTVAILLDQLNGALADAIHRTIACIAESNWRDATDAIDALLSRRDIGHHLTKPWRVVVCGPPNVGKSSLINALAGYERAIVSPTPGTTRDVVTITTAIDGWPIQLADTAGLRATQDELESAGIALAAKTVSEADLVLVMRDPTADSSDWQNGASVELKALADPAVKTIYVINKIDLLSADERSKLSARTIQQKSNSEETLPLSALTGEGVPALAKAISTMLVPTSLPPVTAIPFTMEQFEQLAAARQSIERQDAATATKALQAMLTADGG
jgi:tRNA modification GTPase